MSMRIRYQVGKAWLDVEAESVKEALKDISEFSEIFGETVCAACGRDNAQPRHRVAKGYDFYEVACLSCGAVLSFGQAKEGGRLFPKRRDTDGSQLENNGWYIYRRQQSSDDWG